MRVRNSITSCCTSWLTSRVATIGPIWPLAWPAQPSRFIKEIPAELIEEVRPRVQLSRPVAVGRFRNEEPAVPGVHLGARVRHGKFGEGVILTVEGNGPHARVQVNFEKQGPKWLMIQYANLEPLR